MTVQSIKGNEQQNNWVVPTVAGAAIGGGVGATMLAPAKYKSFEDLVSDATSNDKFEMPKAADDATQEVKDAFAKVKAGIDNTKETNKKLGDLFKDGATEAKAEDVVKAFGKDVPTEVADKKQVVALNEIISKMTKDSDVEITDEMKNIFKGADGTLPNEVDDKVKSLWKTVTGADFPVGENGGKGSVTEAMITTAKKNGEDAAKYLNDNKSVIELMEKATDGKVTREAAENFAKSADAGVSEAFEKISKQLGKSRMKGAAIWGAIGLAAGFVASKLLGNKAEKSA